MWRGCVYSPALVRVRVSVLAGGSERGALAWSERSAVRDIFMRKASGESWRVGSGVSLRSGPQGFLSVFVRLTLQTELTSMDGLSRLFWKEEGPWKPAW